ncbi:MAG: hypothetical protein AAGI53_01705 [Planctomycetota bacterium]
MKRIVWIVVLLAFAVSLPGCQAYRDAMAGYTRAAADLEAAEVERDRTAAELAATLEEFKAAVEADQDAASRHATAAADLETAERERHGTEAELAGTLEKFRVAAKADAEAAEAAFSPLVEAIESRLEAVNTRIEHARRDVDEARAGLSAAGATERTFEAIIAGIQARLADADDTVDAARVDLAEASEELETVESDAGRLLGGLAETATTLGLLGSGGALTAVPVGFAIWKRLSRRAANVLASVQTASGGNMTAANLDSDEDAMALERELIRRGDMGAVKQLAKMRHRPGGVGGAVMGRPSPSAPARTEVISTPTSV